MLTRPTRPPTFAEPLGQSIASRCCGLRRHIGLLLRQPWCCGVVSEHDGPNPSGLCGLMSGNQHQTSFLLSDSPRQSTTTLHHGESSLTGMARMGTGARFRYDPTTTNMRLGCAAAETKQALSEREGSGEVPTLQQDREGKRERPVHRHGHQEGSGHRYRPRKRPHP